MQQNVAHFFIPDWYNRPILLFLHHEYCPFIFFKMSRFWYFLCLQNTHFFWPLTFQKHLMNGSYVSPIFLVWSMDVISAPRTHPDPHCVRPGIIFSPTYCSVNVIQFTASVFVFLCHHVSLSCSLPLVSARLHASIARRAATIEWMLWRVSVGYEL